MQKINLRINTTDGNNLYPEDFIIAGKNTPVSHKELELFIEKYKFLNEDYYTEDVLKAIESRFGVIIDSASFIPDVEVTI